MLVNAFEAVGSVFMLRWIISPLAWLCDRIFIPVILSFGEIGSSIAFIGLLGLAAFALRKSVGGYFTLMGSTFGNVASATGNSPIYHPIASPAIMISILGYFLGFILIGPALLSLIHVFIFMVSHHVPVAAMDHIEKILPARLYVAMAVTFGLGIYLTGKVGLKLMRWAVLSTIAAALFVGVVALIDIFTAHRYMAVFHPSDFDSVRALARSMNFKD